MAYLKGLDEQELYLRLSVGALTRFEDRTDMNFFATFAKLIEQFSKEHKESDEQQIALNVFKEMFPDIRTVAAFFYECTVYDKGVTRPDFDTYCDNLPLGVLGQAFNIIMEEIQRFMPDPSPESGDQVTKGPKGLSAGKTSTKQQAS